MTRSAIARASGLSPSYITTLANRDRGRAPTFATITALQDVLDRVQARALVTAVTGPTLWVPPGS